MNKRFFLAVFLFLIAIVLVSYGRTYTVSLNEQLLNKQDNITLIENY